ncbi:phage scaffolding protein [Ligilactobacillus faecis]|uniref:Phage scaffolding protein n=1 Tax=Ligilactobacillus faecis TaxID=762833 RepID=A0ABV4DQL2_9LACO
MKRSHRLWPSMGKPVADLTDQVKALTNERDGLKYQVGDRDKQLDILKQTAGDNEALQKQIKQLQDDNKSASKEYKSKLTSQAS